MTSERLRRFGGYALKMIGVVIFAWMLKSIDFRASLAIVGGANASLIAAAFATLLLSYVMKTVRWRTLVASAGVKTSFGDAWKLYTIGIFLGNLTPSNLGELGKVPYLRRHGIPTQIGTTIVGLDRLLDIAVMAWIGIASVGVLLSWRWALVLLLIGVAGLMTLWLLRSSVTSVKRGLQTLGVLPHLLDAGTIARLLLQSACVWTLYFAWTCMLARGLGIAVPVPQLASAITLTSVVALFPVAPAGLGTRDAAMLAFLTPLGVTSSQSLSYSFLFFILVVLSCVPGLISWVRGIKI